MAVWGDLNVVQQPPVSPQQVVNSSTPPPTTQTNTSTVNPNDFRTLHDVNVEDETRVPTWQDFWLYNWGRPQSQQNMDVFRGDIDVTNIPTNESGSVPSTTISIQPGGGLDTLNQRSGGAFNVTYNPSQTYGEGATQEGNNFSMNIDYSKLPTTRYGSVENVAQVPNQAALFDRSLMYWDDNYGWITPRTNINTNYGNKWYEDALGPILIAALTMGAGALAPGFAAGASLVGAGRAAANGDWAAMIPAVLGVALPNLPTEFQTILRNPIVQRGLPIVANAITTGQVNPASIASLVMRELGVDAQTAQTIVSGYNMLKPYLPNNGMIGQPNTQTSPVQTVQSTQGTNTMPTNIPNPDGSGESVLNVHPPVGDTAPPGAGAPPPTGTGAPPGGNQNFNVWEWLQQQISGGGGAPGGPGSGIDLFKWAQFIPAMATAYNQYRDSDRYLDMGRTAAEMASPITTADRRAQNEIYLDYQRNPQKFLDNNPVYQAALREGLRTTENRMNTMGYGGSGVLLSELNERGNETAGQFVADELNRLRQDAGYQFDPANAAKYYMQGVEGSINSRNMALAALMSPFGSAASNPGGAAGGAPTGGGAPGGAGSPSGAANAVSQAVRAIQSLPRNSSGQFNVQDIIRLTQGMSAFERNAVLSQLPMGSLTPESFAILQGGGTNSAFNPDPNSISAPIVGDGSITTPPIIPPEQDPDGARIGFDLGTPGGVGTGDPQLPPPADNDAGYTLPPQYELPELDNILSGE